jgi:DNA segregation ATPase FtsK/SpoIIIE-like protein
MAWFSKAGKARREKEREREQQQREYKRLEKVLDKESLYWEERLITILGNAGMEQDLNAYYRPNWMVRAFTTIMARFGVGSPKTSKRRVKFTHRILQPDRIWFRIDGDDLPRGTLYSDFKDERIPHHLTNSLNRRVKYEESPKAGGFIVVERDGSVSGIPEFVKMSLVQKLLKAEQEPKSLRFAIGMGENRELRTGNLVTMEHILVGGSTGQGKSNWINQFLTTLAAENAPDILRMVLLDLKNGNELFDYAALPHLVRTKEGRINGIIDRVDKVEGALKAVIDLIEERASVFKGYRNLEEWNAAHPEQRFPYILVVIDELSLVLHNESKEVRKVAKYLLNHSLSIARSYGFRFVLCTQDPSSKVVPTYITHNCTTRVAFRCVKQSQSITILGSGAAHNLPQKGRGVFQDGNGQFFFQAPRIETHHIQTAVRWIVAKYGNPQPEKEPLGLYDLLEFALHNLDGKLALEKLQAEFVSQGLNEKRINELLKSADNNEYEIDGEWYLVERKLGRSGRSLKKVVRHLADSTILEEQSLAAD